MPVATDLRAIKDRNVNRFALLIYVGGAVYLAP